MKKVEHVVVCLEIIKGKKTAVVRMTDIGGNQHIRRMPFCKSYYWRNLEKSRKYHVEYNKHHQRGRNRDAMAYYRAHRDEIVERRKQLYHVNVKEARRKARLYSKKWRAARKKHISDYSRARRYERLEGVFRKMGGKCKCCGETERGFLSIDHVNGGASKYRKTHHYNWRRFCIDIEESGFDPKLYQVLCYNCNMGRERNGGVCPHKSPFIAPKVKTVKKRRIH